MLILHIFSSLIIALIQITCFHIKVEIEITFKSTATFFEHLANNYQIERLYSKRGKILNWDSVVDDLGPRLYRFYSMRCNDLLAADYVQETFARLYQKVSEGKFNPNTGSLKSFAFGIAVNIQKEAYRDQTKWSHSELDHEKKVDPSQSQDSDSELRKIDLKRAICTLSTSEQQVIQLLVDKDLKLEEIGDILEIPINTVKSHVARSKKKIKEFFSNKESDYDR